jgi:hypothetical protein
MVLTGAELESLQVVTRNISADLAEQNDLAIA